MAEYHLSYITDSSNHTDDFLRNRLRHHVMPLLRQENPRLSENWSALALRLRQDEQALSQNPVSNIAQLKDLDSARRNRALAAFLEENGVFEPAAEHIALAEKLVFSQNPSAKAAFPGGVTIGRRYDRLERLDGGEPLAETELNHPGMTYIPHLHMTVKLSEELAVCGKVVLRSRKTGDTIRLSGGTKTLKKLFIDKKIPAAQRERIPVIADDRGVIYVHGMGVNLDRITGKETSVPIEIIPDNK